MIYFQETDFQRTFYSHFRDLGQQPRPFPFLSTGYDQYLLMRDVFWRLQPFQFLREGNRAVQVGFTDSYLLAGLSHPLIMSAIVGERGHVLAIDFDERNAHALVRYVEDNHIGNITVAHAAIWKEREPVTFAVYHRSSTNTAIPVIHGAKTWFDRHAPAELIRHITMDAETLDAVVKGSADFVNLTVNGAESECLQGAAGLMERNPNIVFAFPAGNVGRERCDWLDWLGFDVGLSHAPHAPWEIGSTPYACATRKGRDRFCALGFAPLEGGLEAMAWDGKRMF
jgi:FkbM family methyltransferase